jgi:hypothetical protein
MKNLSPVILVIGYNETEILTGSSLGSDGIREYKEFTLLGKMVGKFTDANEANISFQDAAERYEYVEIKTVYELF